MRLVNEHEIRQRHGDIHPRRHAARTFANEVNIGMVGVKCADPGAARLPQLWRLEALDVRRCQRYGPEGVRFYSHIKTVTTRWPTGIRAGAEYTMPSLR